MSCILHIDINSYFATLLQQKYPSLRGKPVGIIKDVGRTCVIAASKEAKALGVITGSNTREAKLRAPGIILQPAEFDLYLDSTRRLQKLFLSIAPHVQIYSLDEAFIDISDCSLIYPHPHRLAIQIKLHIKKELGEWVTCNIGISRNRFLAKLGSELSPKDSIITVDKHNQDDFLSTTDFKSVCGVGYRLEHRLHALGIESLYALNFVGDDFLHQHFGPFWSVQLRRMSQGKEPHLFSTIDQNPHMKSVSRSITGYRPTKNQQEIKQILYNLSAEVIHKVRVMDLVGRQIYVKLYGSRHQTFWSNFITVKTPINHLSDFFEILYYRLGTHQVAGNFPVIKFAVRLSLLIPKLSDQLLPDWQKQERLASAVDKLWHKYGLFSVYSGLLGGKQIIKPEVTGFFGDKKFYFG